MIAAWVGTDEWVGGALLGYVDADYATMVRLFGQPIFGGDKTEHEWVVRNQFGEMTVATVDVAVRVRDTNDGTGAVLVRVSHRLGERLANVQ